MTLGIVKRHLIEVGCVAFIGVVIWLTAWNTVWFNAQTSTLNKENAVLCAQIRHNAKELNATIRNNPKEFHGWTLFPIPEDCHA